MYIKIRMKVDERIFKNLIFFMKNNINLLIRSITKLTFFVIILVFQIKPVNAQTATLPVQ